MGSEEFDGSGPSANQSQIPPDSSGVGRRITKGLHFSCVTCIKFLDTKRKRMNRIRGNKKVLKDPANAVTSRPDFRDLLAAIDGYFRSHYPDIHYAPNFHYHFHTPGKSASKRTGERRSEMDQTKSERVVATTADETTQDGAETAQSSSEISAMDDETTQVSGEAAQTSSGEFATVDDVIIQDSGETAQSSSEDVATDDDAITQDSGETAQSSSEDVATDDDAITQDSGETIQSGSEFSTPSNETASDDQGPPVALAIAAVLVPAIPPLFEKLANVNYDYD